MAASVSTDCYLSRQVIRDDVVGSVEVWIQAALGTDRVAAGPAIGISD